jgi:hypothetical protein
MRLVNASVETYPVPEGVIKVIAADCEVPMGEVTLSFDNDTTVKFEVGIKGLTVFDKAAHKMGKNADEWSTTVSLSLISEVDPELGRMLTELNAHGTNVQVIPVRL